MKFDNKRWRKSQNTCMKCGNYLPKKGDCKCQSGFTFIEVCVSMGLALIVFMALYTCIYRGFDLTKQSRENLRGTQIVVEKLESIRLYNWNQLNYSNMIPASFTDYYTPSNSNKGITYYGTVQIVPVTFTTDYNTNVRSVTVTVLWTNKISITRTMTTYVSKDGAQNYIYNN